MVRRAGAPARRRDPVRAERLLAAHALARADAARFAPLNFALLAVNGVAPYALDPENSARLWAVSEALIA
nr:hypothetical protein [Streptomyces sp. 846.5]